MALRLAATVALAVMFALVKLAAGHGVHIVETLFYRQAFALIPITIWIMAGPGFSVIRTNHVGIHVSRMMVGLTAMTLNFLGMAMLPLAEATSIGFTTPIFATLLAALILHEMPGPWRWGAVLAGFIGVLIILRPGGINMFVPGHVHGAAIALGGAAMTAAVSILIRQLTRTEATHSIVFWFSLLSMVPLGLLMLRYGQMHDARGWLLLGGIGLVGGIAQLFLTASLRAAPVGVVLPVDYMGLIWSAILGWMLFGDQPPTATWIGAVVIIASGLLILWSEQRAKAASTSQATSIDGIAT